MVDKNKNIMYNFKKGENVSKILITSDWHIESGIYTDIGIEYLNFVEDYCKENNIEKIIIAGDLVEKASKIKNDSFKALFFKLFEMKNNGLELIIILGNHDIYTNDNDSLIEIFSVFGKVIKSPEQMTIYNRQFDMVPYTKREDDLPKEGDILITHISIADFSFDNNYHVNEKVAFAREYFKDFNYVFSGHFHKQQTKDNITYIGSPYQLSFGEEGQDKGFIVFDCKTSEWERINYTKAPKYITFNAKDYDKQDVKNKFVRVRIKEKLDNFVSLKLLLYERGAIEVKPSFEEEKEEINISNETDGFDYNADVVKMLEEYILNFIEVKDVDNKKLLKKFQELVND